MKKFLKNNLKPANKVPDILAPNLKILFCGINPGLYSAAVGHNFARPGNRFWKVLYQSGLTPKKLLPFEEKELLKYGFGITNLANRVTALASELNTEELTQGKKILEEKIKKYNPKVVAVLGIEAYKKAFTKPNAKLGLQPERINKTKIWVLPNPSGLNAYYQFKNLKSSNLLGLL